MSALGLVFAAACTDGPQAPSLDLVTAPPAADIGFLYMYDLPDLPGADVGSTALAINNWGQIAGIGCTFDLGTRLGCYYPVEWNRYQIWSHTITQLDTLSPYEDLAQAINDLGQIVGYSGFPSRAVIWNNGVISDLGTPAGCQNNTTAWDINNWSIVVGTCRMLSDGELHAIVWNDGVTTDLGVGTAYAISDRNVVAGTSGGRAVTWTLAGVMTDLGPGVARDINERGQVVGESGGRAVRWWRGALLDIAPGVAQGINWQGSIVGRSAGHAFAWDGGTFTDLGEGEARQINEWKQIVGWSAHFGAVVWRRLPPR